MLARDPFVRASPGLPARGQAVLFPTRDAAFEIGGLEAGPREGCRHALADLVPVHAVRNDRVARRQFLPPALDLLGRTVECADDQSVVGAEGVLTANIDQDRRRRRTQARIQIMWGK